MKVPMNKYVKSKRRIISLTPHYIRQQLSHQTQFLHWNYMSRFWCQEARHKTFLKEKKNALYSSEHVSSAFFTFSICYISSNSCTTWHKSTHFIITLALSNSEAGKGWDLLRSYWHLHCYHNNPSRYVADVWIRETDLITVVWKDLIGETNTVCLQFEA